MPSSISNNLVEELLKSIQSTTSLIQGLMQEMKDNASALATLEVKLESLTENAKTLSKIVRDDNGNKSVLTRIALLENDLGDLLNNHKEFKAYLYKKIEETAKTTGEQRIELMKVIDTKKDDDGKSKWIMASLQIAPGVIALVLVVIKIVWGIDIGL